MLSDARAKANTSHEKMDQRRKGTGEPYVVHLDSVVLILKAHGISDENIISAAYLHDTVEDTDLTLKEISAEFGEKVALLVAEVTDVYVLPEHGNRATRKAAERKRLAGVSEDAKAIKLADLTDNVSTIVKSDPNFAPKYLQEKLAVLNVLKTEKYSALYKTAQKALEAAKKDLDALRG